MDKVTAAEAYLGALEKLIEHYERAFNNARRRDLERLGAQFSLEVRPIFEGIQKQFPEDGVILHSLIGTEIGRYITISTVYSCISYLRAITNNANPKYLNTLLENAEILKEEKLYSCSMLCVRLYCEDVLKRYIPESDAKGKPLGKLYNMVMDKYPESLRESNWRHIDTLNSVVHNDGDVKPSASIIEQEIRWVKEFKKDTETVLSDEKSNS